MPLTKAARPIEAATQDTGGGDAAQWHEPAYRKLRLDISSPPPPPSSKAFFNQNFLEAGKETAPIYIGAVLIYPVKERRTKARLQSRAAATFL
jgi:hypothetical protein